MTVAGFTSTGSKRPDALYGAERDGLPLRMLSSRGCMVRASDGRDYLDAVMALGAVALGYGHPAVNAAVIEAVERGTIGPLAPDDEAALAAELVAFLPWVEEVRFLKTGAEAAAAAVRLARTATGRERVLGCGYHGWLDWCSSEAGVPASTRALYGTVPFNDPERTRERIRDAADHLAAVIVEPMVEAAPSAEWLAVLREETARCGAALIFDEIKTAFRVARGGASERWGVRPDLVILGKALANGYPLAAVAGTRPWMRHVAGTWISSTMATEFVSLAAARATLRTMTAEDLPARLALLGGRLYDGLTDLALRHELRVIGIPVMCALAFDDDAASARLAVACARRGLLWKRGAYNFVSLAHDAGTIERMLDIVAEALREG